MIEVILCHKIDKSYTISIRNITMRERFHVRIFYPSYLEHDVYREAYRYAYALSSFLLVDLIEINQFA